MRTHAENAGFTLLEMLVALALTAILAAGLYMSLHIGFSAKARAEQAMAPVRAAVAALDFVRDSLESAPRPTGVLAGAFVGEDATAASGGAAADTLAFVSAVEDSVTGGNGLARVEFVVEGDSDGTDGALVRRITTNLLAPEAPEPVEEVLCRNVKAFNLTYYDGAQWLDTWDSGTMGNMLPVAVRAELSIADERPGDDEEAVYAASRIFMLPCGIAQAAE